MEKSTILKYKVEEAGIDPAFLISGQIQVLPQGNNESNFKITIVN